jgi:1-acyl-sn-glycerol-3-phosphate acyltransferase
MEAPLGFKFFQKFLILISKFYFQADVKGLENIPSGPCLLVGNHNAIAIVNPEAWIFGCHYFNVKNSLRVLGHDLVFKIPHPFVANLQFYRSKSNRSKVPLLS